MDEEIKNYIDESLKKNKPGFFRSHLVELIAVILSAFALFVSFMSYRVSYDQANPKVNYEIINDYSANSNEFINYIERYLNDWNFNDKDFNFYLKIKNVNPNISSKLDQISGEIEIEFWTPTKENNSKKVKFKKISDETIYLPSAPVNMVVNNNEISRPIIDNLSEGFIKYEYPKEGIWGLDSRFTYEEIYSMIKEFNYFDVSTTYGGNYPIDYEPEDEEYYRIHELHELRMNPFEDLPDHIDDIFYKQFIKVIIRVRTNITDHLNNKYENNFTIIYDGWVDNPYYHSKYRTAVDLYNNKEFDKAKEILIEINSFNKYNSNVNYLLGLIYLRQDKDELGIDFLKSASNRDEKAALELARYYLHVEKYDKAINYLEKYFIRYYTPYLGLKIDTLEMIENNIINKLNMVIENQKHSISTIKSYSKCLYVLGINYMEYELMDKAEYFIEKANELNNNNIYIKEKLGIVYSSKENYEKALNMFSECIALAKNKDWEIIGNGSTNEVFNTYRLGNTYRELEMYKESLDVFKNMLNSTETNVWNYFGNAGLGFVYFDLGELTLSRSYFVKAKSVSDKSEYIRDYLKEQIEDKLSIINNNPSNN